MPTVLSPVPEELIVPGGEVNQMAQVALIKPSDVWCEVTHGRRKPDFDLLPMSFGQIQKHETECKFGGSLLCLFVENVFRMCFVKMFFEKF